MSQICSLLAIAIALTLQGISRGDDLPLPADRKVDFAADVRPILAKSCFRCHGEKAMKGGLVLDQKADAMRGGDDGPVIVAGKSAESRLIRYVAGIDDDTVMPPAGSGDPLTPEQVGVLRAWIDRGAAWPEALAVRPNAKANHWSLRAPARPTVPSTKNPAWVRNPIDAFVLAQLDRKGMRPSPEADRPTLLRRLSLDLIGLPPTLEELDGFLADTSPDAFEKQVDRLLASPHYGERWARRWLDRARYADTNGYEKDRERSIWPYRDWVIDALNRDMPFDQFTVEQLAGDLLPEPSIAQKVATGFHRNTMINEEGGIDVEEFRFASIVDRVATTGSVWLGLTVGCAQCHTHKYDPITHRDYYRLFAFFNNADEPDLTVPSAAIEAEGARIEAEARALEAGRADRFPTRDEALDSIAPVVARLESSSGVDLGSKADGLIVASGRHTDADTYRIEFELPPGRYSAIRLETTADPKSAEPGPGRTKHGNFVVTEFSASVGSTPIAFSGTSADVAQPGFPVAQAIDGDPRTGWAVDAGEGSIRKPHSAEFVAARPIEVAAPGRMAITIGQDYGGGHTLGRFRIKVKRDLVSTTPEPERRAQYLALKQAEWERARVTHDWTMARPGRVASKGHATMEVLPDLSVLARGDKPNNDVYEVDLEGDFAGTTALRLEVLPHPTLPDDGPGRAPLFSVGDFFLSDIKVAGESGLPVPIVKATEDYCQPGHPAMLAIDGATDTGWTIQGGVGKPHAAVFTFREPLPGSAGRRLRVTLTQLGIHQTTIGRFRIAATKDRGAVAASGLPAEVEACLRVPKATRTVDQLRTIREYYLSVAPELGAINRRIADLRKSRPHSPTSMVIEERRPSEARRTQIHKRGEFLQLGDAVEPGVPPVLPPLPSDAPRDRLGLARWLVAPENPLTARVFVNQAWQAFFGRGIVATVDDFGTRGALPTHPELLDWLATEAVRLGWSQKAIHRLIVTSATYRQSSKSTPAAIALDPNNDWLARGPRFRVEAEAVRDIALRVGGLLNPAMGGPSVYPPQPDGVTALSYGQVGWPTSKGADRYRRGLYTYTKRTAPYATFGLFDAPSSDGACTRRERSNTPLQALTLLNDPVYMEAARALASRVLGEVAVGDEARLRHAFRLCTSRLPSAEETAMLARFLDHQRDRARRGEITMPPGVEKSPIEPAERAAWTAVARVLLNLDETITKE